MSKYNPKTKTDDMRTAKQWRRKGMVPKRGKAGHYEYSGAMYRKYGERYYLPSEVRPMTDREKRKEREEKLIARARADERAAGEQRQKIAVQQRTFELLAALGMDVYTVAVRDYVPQWILDEGYGYQDFFEGDKELLLTYAGASGYSVGDRVKVVVKGELYIGRITARGRDVELYADFPAGLRQIKSRVEP